MRRQTGSVLTNRTKGLRTSLDSGRINVHDRLQFRCMDSEKALNQTTAQPLKNVQCWEPKTHRNMQKYGSVFSKPKVKV